MVRRPVLPGNFCGQIFEELYCSQGRVQAIKSTLLCFMYYYHVTPFYVFSEKKKIHEVCNSLNLTINLSIS